MQPCSMVLDAPVETCSPSALTGNPPQTAMLTALEILQKSVEELPTESTLTMLNHMVSCIHIKYFIFLLHV